MSLGLVATNPSLAGNADALEAWTRFLRLAASPATAAAVVRMLLQLDGPARAVRCALAIRDGLRGLGIEIRVGLHTGETERRGQNVGGMAVHISARIQALAQPGELLVSRTVKDLVAGSALAFTDRGIRQLKGIPEEWQIFAVDG